LIKLGNWERGAVCQKTPSDIPGNREGEEKTQPAPQTKQLKEEENISFSLLVVLKKKIIGGGF